MDGQEAAEAQLRYGAGGADGWGNDWGPWTAGLAGAGATACAQQSSMLQVQAAAETCAVGRGPPMVRWAPYCAAPCHAARTEPSLAAPINPAQPHLEADAEQRQRLGARAAQQPGQACGGAGGAQAQQRGGGCAAQQAGHEQQH